MGSQRNPNSGNFKDILKRIYKLEHAAPMNNAAIGRDGLLVYDGGVITIENGGLNITGSATISGTLDVSGITNLGGINNLTGENHLTGPTDVAGNFEIIDGGLFRAGESVINPDGSAEFGGLSIAPDGTLTSGLFELNPDGSAKFGEMTIDADGKITTGETVIETSGRAAFGDFVIDPSSDRLIEAPGGWLFSDGPDSLGLASSNTSSVNLNGSYAELNFDGGSVVRAETGMISLNSPKTNINGNLAVSGNQVSLTGVPSTASQPNVRISATGFLYRSTWVPA